MCHENFFSLQVLTAFYWHYEDAMYKFVIDNDMHVSILCDAVVRYVLLWSWSGHWCCFSFWCGWKLTTKIYRNVYTNVRSIRHVFCQFNFTCLVLHTFWACMSLIAVMGKSKSWFYLNCNLTHFGDLIWYDYVWFEAPAIRFAIRFEIFTIRFEKS